MTVGQKFTIKRKIRVYDAEINRWKRKTIEQKATYLGIEGSRYLFETEEHTELLVHGSDLEDVISETN